MQAKLVDPVLGREYPLSGKMRIGRGDDNDIPIPVYHEDTNKLLMMRRVSRRHATIQCKNGRYFVEDSSTNGTLVNGTLVKMSEIKNGDELKLPAYPLKVVIE